jgi:anaerobic selenocysteine-containing dehydrogenase
MSGAVVFLSAQDLKSRGLKSGDVVDLTSHFEDEERRAPRFICVEYPIPQGCAATYFPETNVWCRLAASRRNPTRQLEIGGDSGASRRK